MIKLFGGLPHKAKEKNFANGKFNGHQFKVGSSYQTCNFDRCDFRGASSRSSTEMKKDPSPVSFIASNLTLCDFRGTDINQAILAGSKIDGCDFSGAHLAHALMVHATIKGVHFAGAILYGVNFKNADMSWVDFRSADMRESDWEGAKVYMDNPMGDYQFTSFANARLSKSRFVKTKLTAVDFRHCEAFDVDFTGADLRGADFRGAKLNNSTFTNANLEGADFRGAFMDGCLMSGVNLDSINFPRAFYTLKQDILFSKKFETREG